MNKNQHEEAIQILKAFVSGEMDIEVFWKNFNTNRDILQILLDDPCRPNEDMLFYSAERLMDRVDIHTISGASALYLAVKKYFLRNKIPTTYDTKYEEKEEFLIFIQPSWLDIPEAFLQAEILSKMPQDISRPQQVKWCKARIKELFRYEKVPPRWWQNPEWPFNAAGKPMTFLYQKKPSKDDCRFLYHFQDPDSGKETIVEQLD